MALDPSRNPTLQALASLERYLAENLEERVGNIAASALLNSL